MSNHHFDPRHGVDFTHEAVSLNGPNLAYQGCYVVDYRSVGVVFGDTPHGVRSISFGIQDE